MKSITKGPRMDFPRFDGTDPVGWIRQCNKYFQMAGAPEEFKVSLSQLYIVGRADVWLRRSGLLKKHLSWKNFCNEIVLRYSATGSYDLTDKFNSLKQHNTTVDAYTDTFEDLMADVQEENPNISEQWFVRCYVNGLREGIKFQLRPLRPVTLTEAYWMAKDMEPNHPPKRQFNSYGPQYQKFSAHPAATTRQTQNYTPPITVPKHSEPALAQPQRVRKPGECWRCGGKWGPGHKC
jgi:hypothetical protein